MQPLAKLWDLFADQYAQQLKRQGARGGHRGVVRVADMSLALEGLDQGDAQKFYHADPADLHWSKKDPGAWRLLGRDRYEAVFHSQLHTPYPAANRVPVTWFRNRKRESRPTLLIIHGLRMADYHGMDRLPAWFAAHGIDAVLLDLPYHMRRTPDGYYSGQLGYVPDTTWLLAMFRQCVVDFRAVALWLQGQGIGPVGTFGISLGALIGLVLACVAPEVRFTIALVPGVDIHDCIQNTHEMSAFLARYRRDFGEEHPLIADENFYRLLSPIGMDLAHPPENLFMASALEDRFITPGLARQTADRWGLGPENFHLYDTGHISCLTANPPLYADVDRFLRRVGRGAVA